VKRGIILPGVTFMNFFAKSKALMQIIVRRKNWTKVKESLPILLSIQKQYYHNLDPKGWMLRIVKRRINCYEFILNSFNPGDVEFFLNLFHYLQSMAYRYEGKVPDDLAILKALKLFKTYCYHFYFYDWEMLDDLPSIPPKLLFLVIFKLSKCLIFELLRNPKKFSHEHIFTTELFQKVINSYVVETGIKFIGTAEKFCSSPDFTQFLNRCIESGENICNLGKKETWIIKAILQIIPITNSYAS
jgi:hypothetical protein